MPELKVLVTSPCVGANKKHYSRGDIRIYDDENGAHQTELAALRAAGRIAPVTKENVAFVLEAIRAADPKAKIPADLRKAALELKVEVPADPKPEKGDEK